MPKRNYTIADVLGFGSTPPNLLQPSAYRKVANSIPRNEKYQGAISRAHPTATQELAQLITPNTKLGADLANKLEPAIDMSPLGILTGLVDARRAYESGNNAKAAGLGIMAALGAIPGGKVESKAGKKAIEAAVDRGIIAYHGSPHSFDRFDMSKIGTGEGAQAYGHGLYFAEAENVARNYRQKLERVLEEPFRKVGLTEKEIDVAKSFAKQTDVSSPDVAARDFASWTGKKLTPELVDAFKSAKQPGSMYQIKINANPENFLDWDKPLVEQPKQVREAIASAISGGDELAVQLLGDLSGPEAMQIAGLLPKSKGSQVYNTLKYNQKPVGFDESGEPLFSGMAALDNRNPKAATDALLKAGIPGIKYFDQGSRSAGEGSRNYVVFDDSLIDILKKYGIAIPAIAGGGLLATQPQQDGGL